MIKKLIFYNNYHNGDQHACRGFVREIITHCVNNGIECFYYHNCDPCLISDIPNLIHINKPNVNFSDKKSYTIKDGILYFNTWYMVSSSEFKAHSGSFATLYLRFKRVCKETLKFDLSPGNDPDYNIRFFPWIDYSKFEINGINKFIENNNKKLIFVSNGSVKSGQVSKKFSFTPIIIKLASNHNDYIFLLSNKDKEIIKLHNVIYTKDIIKKNSNDLNENGYLSTFCDTIMGSASGSYSFAINKSNFFDNKNKNKKFLCFIKDNNRTDKVDWISRTLKYRLLPDYKVSILPCYDLSNKSVYKFSEKHL